MKLWSRRKPPADPAADEPNLASPVDPGSSLAPATPAVRGFPIVGIGASAGGLEAFRRLLGALPSDTGMAYVLVQHLDPLHESILAELLSEATPMEVSEVKGDVRVEPNQVYVIPPSKDMVLDSGLLKLVARSTKGAAHMPIDSFLRTLADVQGSQAIGVILSGMGSDGTLGLQAIEAQGGIAFAQEPASAKSGDMPKSAIGAGGVDFVLTPEGIARELARLGRHPYLATAQTSQGPADASASTGEEDKGRDAEGLARVLELLRKASGTDFGAYKKTTLRRRVARRMAVRQIETLDEYARLLEDDAAEGAALYDDCLISVTSFFRDPDVFQALSEEVLPLLLKDRPPDSALRVWVPACATGEEVYSIAMCLLEQTAELSPKPPLQLFATDLSEGALVKAREGTYLENIARDVSPERLRRFFAKVGGHYQISKAIREMCVFARHDLTRDPPYSRMDLISCRNVLIYLEARLQEKVFATLHYALRPGGFLVVGPAETAGASSVLFSAHDEKHRIYSRNATTGPPRILSVMRDASPRASAAPLIPKAAGVAEVPREADRMLLARFGPAGVVVDEGLRILEFRGDTDPFLEHGHGQASLNLERLLRKGLLMELRLAVEEARRKDAPVRREGLKVRHREQVRSVALEVIPIKGRAAAEKCLLILFETEEVLARAERRSELAPGDGATPDVKDEEIVRLGQGLAQTTEYLHTLVREHEAALEELQSTNEEALSSNEELQSVNEELQTAKEEIQSANEELATLNQELQDRNVQLGRSNDEIQRALDSANAVVDTVRQPLVILDGELRVEKANAAFYDTFQAASELTRGRLLSEMGGGPWDNRGLLDALKEVVASDTPVEDLEIEAEVPALGNRTLSINARRLHPGGTRGRILVAIEDRTAVKRAERGREALLTLEHDARERAEAADHLKDEFVATVSHELRGPLSVIAGWMNILLGAGQSPDNATLAKALAAIGRGVTAQGRLISDLLDHSRLVAGKVELERAPIDLLTVAEAALVAVRAAAEAKDIDLSLTGDRAASIVLGDADRMQQVLWNLFFNAVKFTSPGGRVRIAVARVGNQVHVTVSDTGRGIPEEFLPHVFERFRQADGSTNRAQHGLGLGLTLVRELVELHGGTVHAESAGQGQGSTFTVVLPIPALLQTLSGLEPDALRPPPVAVAAAAPARPILDGVRLLVVDDEADARDALVGLLERYGAHVRPAASVAEAMALLETNVPDVLISDLGMPGEDGYELIRRVRLLPGAAGGRLPSIAVSAYSTDEHRRKVLATGFQKHLEKPVAAAELVTAVARLAGRAEAVPFG
jgi:two-component system, chemotaxis family, CheB/CheR fusion protein